MKEPVRIIAEPPLFEEWLEREIEKAARSYSHRAPTQHLIDERRGYLMALVRVRQELENGG